MGARGIPGGRPLTAAARRRTASAWGTPGRNHYRFLERVEQERGPHPHLHVIGCADGKFVLPAARRGWRVTAIDVDAAMLHGSPASAELGIAEPVAGLVARLEAERLSTLVDVHRGDFMTAPLGVSDALWTSGSLQYSLNSGYDIADMTARLRELVNPGGLSYVEYMLPRERKLRGRRNCPSSAWWTERFPEQGWLPISHVVLLDRSEPGHPYMPEPHAHSWGRILARRL